MSKKVIYPGTFDPITHGHRDMIVRALSIFDHVVVAIGNNSTKNTWLSLEERLSLTREVLADLNNVSVKSFTGLVVDFVKAENANIILRGVRDEIDLSFEIQQASMNKTMSPDIETVFMVPGDQYRNISSSLVREIARLKGDVSPFVDKKVVEYLWR